MGKAVVVLQPYYSYDRVDYCSTIGTDYSSTVQLEEYEVRLHAYSVPHSALDDLRATRRSGPHPYPPHPRTPHPRRTPHAMGNPRPKRPTESEAEYGAYMENFKEKARERDRMRILAHFR
jgi:hypothetical protein